ncbi:translin-associated protein X [Cryptotermes secundus]|uniref:translin-associated protein X n=1 Tax=Cryptotermes secundus TaxID=105785 RepID=UPI000CD7D51C|nr:translin-associated protein X [Cryptotermes secundus]
MPHQERDRKHNGHHGGGKHKHSVLDKAQEVLESIDASSPVIRSFQQYAAELDFKHDKYERIVKLGRDITIESKRIIFLLHTLDRESKRKTVLAEAMSRLMQLVNTHFKAIAKELKGEDPYQYMKAYSAGLQEYIEAVTFHDYLMNSSLPSWTKIQADLNYTNMDVSTEHERPNTTVTEDNSENTRSAGYHNDFPLKTFVSPVDYILGVADLTGELMRKCINNLGSGDIEGCYQTCTFVREIYSGFLGVSCTGFKEIARKIVTLRQSLSKMENACYMIHVRGSEIPKHMLADVISGTQDVFLEEDEGFC